MYNLTFSSRILTGLLLLLALALTACGPRDPAASAPGRPDIIVALAPAPEGPRGQYLLVTLTDKEGAAITDATVGLEGNMNHAGMVPVLAKPVADAGDGSADGVYTVPFAFSMRGDWIVTVSVNLADGTSFTQNIKLSVTGDEVRVK